LVRQLKCESRYPRSCTIEHRPHNCKSSQIWHHKF